MNTIFTSEEINQILPNSYKKALQEKNATLYVINGSKIANECGLKEKINIIMQTALFKVLKLMPQNDFIAEMTAEIEKNFSKKGKDVVEKNITAMNKSLSEIKKVDISKFTMKEEKLSSKVYSKDFKTKAVGYDVREVDSFLDEINEEVLKLEREIEHLNEKLRQLEGKNAVLDQQNKSISLELYQPFVVTEPLF